MEFLGKFILLSGLVIVAAGLILWLGASFPLVHRLRRLPGDIYVRRGNFSFYFPLATSILISVILSLIVACFRR